MMSFRNLFMERPSYYCLSSRLPVTFRLIQRKLIWYFWVIMRRLSTVQCVKRVAPASSRVCQKSAIIFKVALIA